MAKKDPNTLSTAENQPTTENPSESVDDLTEDQRKIRLADFVQDNDKTFPSDNVALNIRQNVKDIYAAKSPYDMIDVQKKMIGAQAKYIEEQKGATKYMEAWVQNTDSKDLESVTAEIEKHKQNMANYEALMKESSANLLAYAESNAEKINPTELELIRARQKSIEAQNSLISELSKTMELEISSAKAEVEGNELSNAQKDLEESKKGIKRAEAEFEKTEAAVKEIADKNPNLDGDAEEFDKSVGEVQLQEGLAKEWREVDLTKPLPEKLLSSSQSLAHTERLAEQRAQASTGMVQPAPGVDQTVPGVGGDDGLVVQPKGPVVSRNPNLAKEIQDTIAKALAEHPQDKDAGGKVANERVHKIFERERQSNGLDDVAPELFGGKAGVGPDSTENNLNIFEIDLDKMARDKVPGTCMFVPRNNKDGIPERDPKTGAIIQDVIYFDDKGVPTGLDIISPEPPPTSIGPNTIKALEVKLDASKIRRTTPPAPEISTPIMAKGPTQGQGLGPTPPGPGPSGPAPQPNPALTPEKQIEQNLQKMFAAGKILDANMEVLRQAEALQNTGGKLAEEQQNLIALRDQVTGGFALIDAELKPDQLQPNNELTPEQVTQLAADLAKAQAFDAAKFNTITEQARLSSEAVDQQGKTAATVQNPSDERPPAPKTTGQAVDVTTNTTIDQTGQAVGGPTDPPQQPPPVGPGAFAEVARAGDAVQVASSESDSSKQVDTDKSYTPGLRGAQEFLEKNKEKLDAANERHLEASRKSTKKIYKDKDAEGLASLDPADRNLIRLSEIVKHEAAAYLSPGSHPDASDNDFERLTKEANSLMESITGSWKDPSIYTTDRTARGDGYLEVAADRTNPEPTRTVSSDSGNGTGSENGDPQETAVEAGTQPATETHQPGDGVGDSLLRVAVDTENPVHTEPTEAATEADQPAVEAGTEVDAAAGRETDPGNPKNVPTEEERKALEEQAKREAASQEKVYKAQEALNEAQAVNGTLGESASVHATGVSQNQQSVADARADAARGNSNTGGLLDEEKHVQSVFREDGTLNPHAELGSTHYYPGDRTEPSVAEEGLYEDPVTQNPDHKPGDDEKQHEADRARVGSVDGPPTPAQPGDQPIVQEPEYDELAAPPKINEPAPGYELFLGPGAQSLDQRRVMLRRSQSDPTRMDPNPHTGHDTEKTKVVHEDAIERSKSSPAAGDLYVDPAAIRAAKETPVSKRAQSFKGFDPRKMEEGVPPHDKNTVQHGSTTPSSPPASPEVRRRNSQDKGSKIGDGQ